MGLERNKMRKNSFKSEDISKEYKKLWNIYMNSEHLDFFLFRASTLDCQRTQMVTVD